MSDEYRRRLAWRAGQRARQNGKSQHANDRQVGTIFHDDWNDGWMHENDAIATQENRHAD